MTVESEEQAGELFEVPKVRLWLAAENEARTKRGEPERVLEAGEFLSLPPCLKPAALADFQKERGRPCPRVELDPENAHACSLFTTLSRDVTRPMALELFRAESRERGWAASYRLQIMRRATVALLDPDIAEAMRPKAPVTRQKKA
jgi:hypothetical protein